MNVPIAKLNISNDRVPPIWEIVEKVNQLVEWVNNQMSESKSLPNDYLNKNREEWLKASKNDGV